MGHAKVNQGGRPKRQHFPCKWPCSAKSFRKLPQAGTRETSLVHARSRPKAEIPLRSLQGA